MRRLIAIGLVLAVSPVTAQQPSPTFRAGIDLITVEVSVVDDQSRPVPDLAAADFEVKIDGQVRRVVSARFVEATRGAATPIAGEGVIPSHAANYGAPEGRIVVFVVDRDAIASGSERAVLNAATTMLDALGPADAAGAVALPQSSVELTRDKDRVKAALLRMTGTRPPSTMQIEDRKISWDEALAFERRDPRSMAEVIERECRQMKTAADGPINHCPDEVRALSFQMLQTGRQQMQQTMAGLHSLLDRLKQLRGTKHLVLLSGGLPFGQDLMQHYNTFARDAAEAEVIVHAVHLEAFEGDAANRKIVTSAFGSRDFMTGLGTLASMTGGAFYEASGSGAGIFARITTAMSGFYQLGVETAPADRAGGSKPIDVTVNRRGTTARYGRRILAPAADPAADRVANLLQQPIDINELPIAIASYTMRGDEAETLRLLVSAELGRPGSAVDWGYVVLNDGNPIATGRQHLDAGETAGTLSGKLLPGRYRLRTAALDAEGRAAVMEVPISVGLRTAGALQLSDVILGSAADGRLQARATFKQGEAISGLFEILSADPAVLEKTRAVFEVAQPGSAAPLKRYLMAARADGAATRLTNQIEVQTASLPPGLYIATVIPRVDDQPVGRVSRRFEITAPR